MIVKLEQFVRNLMSDQSFRESTLRAPEEAVARFGLTGAERHGALQLCAQLTGANATASPNSTWV